MGDDGSVLSSFVKIAEVLGTAIFIDIVTRCCAIFAGETQGGGIHGKEESQSRS